MTCRSTASHGRGVHWAGAQRDVLSGDIRGHVDLSALSTLPDLYGLGPLEGVTGEISIFRSVPWIARVANGTPVTTAGWDVRACFLVWAQVPVWHMRVVDTALADLEAVEEGMIAVAGEQGMDMNRPFAFHIDGIAADATLHVLDKRDGLPHTAERHEHAKVRQRLAETAVELIGFHSRHHRGVFTPRDSNVHVHA